MMRSSRVHSLVLALGLCGCVTWPDPATPTGAEGLTVAARAQERQRAATLHRDGLRLATGDGVPADPERGATLIREAAELGHAEAQAYVGMSHLVGTIDATRARAAEPWLERAANQGHAAAAHRLGRLHVDGVGVPRDLAWAAVWLERAAERGHADAQFELALLQIAASEPWRRMAEAVAWLTRAAQAGHPQAERYRDAATARLAPEEAQAVSQQLRRPLRRGAIHLPDGPLLRFVQEALFSLGRAPGPVDGTDGPRTRAALAAFAKDEGLDAERGYSPTLVGRLRLRVAAVAGGA